MDVSGQFHSPAASSPMRELLLPVGWEAGWTPTAVLEIDNNLLPDLCSTYLFAAGLRTQ
jgi:hypothetical protein